MSALSNFAIICEACGTENRPHERVSRCTKCGAKLTIDWHGVAADRAPTPEKRNS